jgi:hypothetical protein
MTIEIHNPELETLLEQRIRAGNFANIEEMLLHTLQREGEKPVDPEKRAPKSLVEFFRESPLVGLELDFERDKDAGRE